MNYHAFFRELLSASPWGAKSQKQSCDPSSMNVDEEDRYKAFPDGSLPQNSQTSILGQVLGFKFQTQQVSLVVSSLLIKQIV